MSTKGPKTNKLDLLRKLRRLQEEVINKQDIITEDIEIIYNLRQEIKELKSIIMKYEDEKLSRIKTRI